MGERASWRTTSSRFLSRLDFFFFSFPFSRVATPGSNKINLNPLVNPIHALSAKLAIPSNPHLPIIALSCVSNRRQFSPLAPVVPAVPRPKQSLRRPVSTFAQTSRADSQGVVSICSPVNTAFAPAMKHIICSDSPRVCRPAARRMIVLGRTTRAVAIVRSTVENGTG
jgi:hypothetical protein